MVFLLFNIYTTFKWKSLHSHNPHPNHQLKEAEEDLALEEEEAEPEVPVEEVLDQMIRIGFHLQNWED